MNEKIKRIVEAKTEEELQQREHAILQVIEKHRFAMPGAVDRLVFHEYANGTFEIYDVVSKKIVWPE